ncbi:hypothetical protein GOP47_0028122 [Adiantum capillus-veneris]|nr:hypothetical protein GOP47_0028122 [Adiantum capillus-veneris]
MAAPAAASLATPAKGKSGASSSESSLKRKRGVFTRELRIMMYGFGDDPDPIPETVSLVEDILVDYVTEMVHKAQDIASRRGKLTTEDLMFLVRKILSRLYASCLMWYCKHRWFFCAINGALLETNSGYRGWVPAFTCVPPALLPYDYAFDVCGLCSQHA